MSVDTFLYCHTQDPGISNIQQEGTYPPYDEGLKADIFIRDSSGKVLNGSVSKHMYIVLIIYPFLMC